MPQPLGPPQMGGTGLSGLCLADDLDGWPAPRRAGANADQPKIFYVANPITSSIQTIRAERHGPRYSYSKGLDFLTSADVRFRPVAIQFGPDGCLYVVDWYNKIISHNEVPRDHPERDKQSGRIWRIRRSDQPRTPPPDLAATPTAELSNFLDHPKGRVAALAWQELADRRDAAIVRDLEKIAASSDHTVAKRLGCCGHWQTATRSPSRCSNGLGAVAPPPSRRGGRAAGRCCSEADFLQVAEGLAADDSPRVRAARRAAPPRAFFNGGKRVADGRPVREPLPDRGWESYDRDFERCLARWAMEKNTSLVAEYLNSPAASQAPLESRILATLALDGPRAAANLVQLLPEISRPPSEEELRAPATHAASPDVAEALRRVIGNPSLRLSVLRTFNRLRTHIDSPEIHDLVSAAAARLWDEDASDTGGPLRLRPFEPLP